MRDWKKSAFNVTQKCIYQRAKGFLFSRESEQTMSIVMNYGLSKLYAIYFA